MTDGEGFDPNNVFSLNAKRNYGRSFEIGRKYAECIIDGVEIKHNFKVADRVAFTMDCFKEVIDESYSLEFSRFMMICVRHKIDPIHSALLSQSLSGNVFGFYTVKIEDGKAPVREYPRIGTYMNDGVIMVSEEAGLKAMKFSRNLGYLMVSIAMALSGGFVAVLFFIFG
jgi:hypothetical protein